MFNTEVWQRVQERQRALIALFTNHADYPLNQLRVLEIGCGRGSNLQEPFCMGFSLEDFVGNELLLVRAALSIACYVQTGDATELTYAEGSFDMVYQSNVLSSLLYDAFQNTLASQIWSWVKPGGGVLCYEFTYNNPRNPDVRGVPIKHIRQLFSEGQIDVHRITLAPPISHRVCKIHPSLTHCLTPSRCYVHTYCAG